MRWRPRRKGGKRPAAAPLGGGELASGWSRRRRRRPDLGLPSLAALLPSPEREGGGSSPKQLGAAVA